MKIIVDDNIPFIQGLLEPYGEVLYMLGAAITAEDMADADALITRTRTRCNAALLDGSRCRFVATATIGLDHIDQPYCASRGITVANAPGCNAPGVAQWVLAAIGHAYPDSYRGKKLGIVGVGHVGSIVDRWARSMGMQTMLCDPPREKATPGGGGVPAPSGEIQFCSLEDIAREADIITFHTPLTREGEDATYHLAGPHFFDIIAAREDKPMIINASRGGVVDEEALLACPAVGPVAIDTWEGEPRINRRLLERADIATYHVAGYSLEGKKRATQMALDAFSRCFSLPRVEIRETQPGPIPDAVTMDAVRASYDIAAETAALKSRPDAFETMRDTYPYRPEPKGA